MSQKKAPKQETPKRRELAIGQLEATGYVALVQQLQLAQQALQKATEGLVLARGVEPAKLRYELAPDGTKLYLIDAD